jgi:hypothetical protein
MYLTIPQTMNQSKYTCVKLCVCVCVCVCVERERESIQDKLVNLESKCTKLSNQEGDREKENP